MTTIGYIGYQPKIKPNQLKPPKGGSNVSSPSHRIETINNERWVAFNIMEYKKQRCFGSFGGGSSDGENWFWCQWCGSNRNYGSFIDVPYCPSSPYPDFDIVDLIRKLGENNYPIFLRFDHVRNKNRFTLVGPLGRIADTDEPFEALLNHCVREFKTGEK